MFALLGVAPAPRMGQIDGARERERETCLQPVFDTVCHDDVSLELAVTVQLIGPQRMSSQKSVTGKTNRIPTLQGTTVASHLRQRKIIFKSTFERGISSLYFSLNVS